MKEYKYATRVLWTGNRGTGTSGYADYGREHEIHGHAKPMGIAGSADAHFRGDASRYNPEDLLVASLSACHMLSYLHVCAVNGVVVTEYEDEATGTMAEDGAGSAQFTEVMLRPRVTITQGSDPEKAMHLHEQAGKLCFIARSVNFPVRHEPVVFNG